MHWPCHHPTLPCIRRSFHRCRDVTETAPHPLLELMTDSPSVTAHDTPTSLVYQPLLPEVPLTVGVMTGGVLSGREYVTVA